MTDPVKAKIIELVPEIESRAAKRAYAIGMGASEWGSVVEITLADVLRAIEKVVGDRTEIENLIETPPLVTQKKELVNRILDDIKYLLYVFDLTTGYDDQTQEVKDFIGRLIGVTE